MLSPREDLFALVLGLAALIGALSLTARWLQRRPAPERWLGIAACLPLLGVAEHWWHAKEPLEFYVSDSVAVHLWLAAFQVLCFLAAARWSSVPPGSSERLSRRDDAIGLVTTGLAGFCAEMFILDYGDHSDVFVPPFPVNTPMWWRTIGWHGWMFWLLTGIGLILSSRALRHGRAAGYLGLALVVSFVAFMHWETFRLDDATLGASVGSVTIVGCASGLCWILAVHRLWSRSV